MSKRLRGVVRPGLRVTVAHPATGVCVITVDGELDTLTTPRLRACVGDQLAAQLTDLILDLQPVTYLGVWGLQGLLDLQHVCDHTSAGTRLHLTGLVTRAVARPLDVTGLRGCFDTYPTIAGALTALAQPAYRPTRRRATSDTGRTGLANRVFSAWWCDSAGTTWVLELRGVDDITLGRPAEWICSGVPIDQPVPHRQTTRLLGEHDLLLYPETPAPAVQLTPRNGHRWLVGYVTRDPEVLKLALLIPSGAFVGGHPMMLAARWIEAGYTPATAADWITNGLSCPASHTSPGMS